MPVFVQVKTTGIYCAIFHTYVCVLGMLQVMRSLITWGEKTLAESGSSGLYSTALFPRRKKIALPLHHYSFNMQIN